MQTTRQKMLSTLAKSAGTKFFTIAAKKTIEALEEKKPVEFHLVESIKFGTHIRAVIAGKPEHLTTAAIRWSDIPPIFTDDPSPTAIRRGDIPSVIKLVD